MSFSLTRVTGKPKYLLLTNAQSPPGCHSNHLWWEGGLSWDPASFLMWFNCLLPSVTLSLKRVGVIVERCLSLTVKATLLTWELCANPDLIKTIPSTRERHWPVSVGQWTAISQICTWTIEHGYFTPRLGTKRRIMSVNRWCSMIQYGCLAAILDQPGNQLSSWLL